MKIIPYIYSFWSLFVFSVFMLAAVPVFIVAGMFGNIGRRKIINGYNKIWARTWRKLTGLQYHIFGLEKIDASKSYMFVINHTSITDAVLLSEAMKNVYAPLAKKEIADIPILGFLIKFLAVYVDRSGKQSRLESIQRLEKLAGKGLSIVIFPEGTRNTNPKVPLAPFHKGAFKIAIEMQMPIVPLVFIGARDLFNNEKLPLKPCKFECYYANPISTKGLDETDMEDLKNRVFNLMEIMVMEHDPNFQRK